MKLSIVVDNHPKIYFRSGATSDFTCGDFKVLINHYHNNLNLTTYLVLSNVIDYDIKLKVSLSGIW